MKSITPGGLAQRLDSGAAPFLLDVRDPDEVVDDGCIAGSVNIPMDEVEDRLGEIPTDREIVVYCHLGARSAYITKKLNALGYDRAVNLTGGHGAWRLYSIEAT
ncbi:MAG: rhodanese-like domain-containing protein [Candidatus Cybelea sp.]